jgi:urocanate hydratase
MAFSGMELQLHTLRLYGELVSRRETWGGALVFAVGEGCSATGLTAAVSIAGGCTLALDPDSAAVKSAFRQGGIDFVVNTLDEALRVLKNEIRQQKPLSVALTSPVEAAQAEMQERGVLPDFLFDFAAPTTECVGWLAEKDWLEAVIEAPTQAAVLKALPDGDLVRRRWLQRIGHYQRLGKERMLWLTAAEAALFAV